jgi:hypothetical protein
MLTICISDQKNLLMTVMRTITNTYIFDGYFCTKMKMLSVVVRTIILWHLLWHYYNKEWLSAWYCVWSEYCLLSSVVVTAMLQMFFSWHYSWPQWRHGDGRYYGGCDEHNGGGCPALALCSLILNFKATGDITIQQSFPELWNPAGSKQIFKLVDSFSVDF